MAQREQIQGLASNGPDDARSFKDLRDRLRQFVDDRDWQQFHSPKNLAISVSVEASELLEQFRWVSDVDSRALDQLQTEVVEEEMADVLLSLVRLADVLNVDLMQAAIRKIAINAKRYPVESSRGNSKKYTDL